MNKKYIAAALELAIVLLVTQIAFVCGKCATLLKRRCTDCGGEYLFLLIPVIYYNKTDYCRLAHRNTQLERGRKAWVNVTPCKGCRYYCGGGSSNRWTYDYILIEHHRRPCPPGKDCTVKKMRKRKGGVKHGETI